MLKIENTVAPSPEQWKFVIMGARNPLESWPRNDSYISEGYGCDRNFVMGPNDHDLLMRLAKNGTDHSKYRRMIPVMVDITGPLYLYKELDTYKVGTVCNSCSTMHKVHAKEFTLADFSTEHLLPQSRAELENTIKKLNHYRDIYINGGTELITETSLREYEPRDKEIWWQMIQLLPTCYNQRRSYSFNYEVLANIYRSRRNHKLDCWHVFCDWIKDLPYSEIIIGEEKGEENV